MMKASHLDSGAGPVVLISTAAKKYTHEIQAK